MKYLCSCHGTLALHNFQQNDEGKRYTLGTWRCIVTRRKCKVVIKWE